MFGFGRKKAEGLKVLVQVPVNIANNLGGLIRAVKVIENEHGVRFDQIEVRLV